jgi:hypothetical protein
MYLFSWIVQCKILHCNPYPCENAYHWRPIENNGKSRFAPLPLTPVVGGSAHVLRMHLGARLSSHSYAK